MGEINWDKIAKKIQDMLKQKIETEGLVKTGTLLNSIKVYSNDNGTFRVEGEDYFKYLDDEYNISSSVFNSSELVSYMENVIAEGVEGKIKDKQ